MNNNLIIFYHDGSRDVYSFPLETDEKKALEQFKSMRPDIQGEDIKKYFFTQNDNIPTRTYGNFCELTENLKLKINLRAFIIIEKRREIKAARNNLLAKLDLPFMRSLEDDNDFLKNHIKKLKRFLRDLPQNLRFNEIENDAEIINYSPFGNIFDIAIIERGSGYETPPNVIIDPPNCKVGFQAKARAFIKEGEVTRIEIIDNGSGYNHLPKITVDAPSEGEQAIVLSGSPQNTTLAQEEVEKNTEKFYFDS